MISMPLHDFYNAATVVKPEVGDLQGKFVVADANWFGGLSEAPLFVPFPAWNVEGTDPKVENIMRTAFAMYQTFTSHYANLQTLLAYMDGLRISENDPIRNNIEQMSNSILLIQQAARDGLDSVAKKLIDERLNRG